MAIQSRSQLALDETVVDDQRLIQALLERESKRQARAELQKEFDQAHERALYEIGKLELPEGRAVRAGQFRIERHDTPARSVAFESKARSSIRISRVDEE